MRSALRSEGLDVQDRLKFGPANDYIRLIPAPDAQSNLEDIQNQDENMVAADTIMRCVREYSEDPNTRIVASIAGGRKSMSALMLSCMSLLGRDQDRLCHVLVNPPYDNPRLDPVFLFPEKGITHKVPGKKRGVRSDKAQISLAEIPFVRMRGWYADKFKRNPPSYADLVARVRKSAPPADVPEPVVINLDKGILTVGELEIRTSPIEFAVALTVIRDVHLKQADSEQKEMLDYLEKIKNLPGSMYEEDKVYRIREAVCGFDFDDTEDFRKKLSRVRTKVKQHAGQDVGDWLFPAKRGAKRRYPASAIKIKGSKELRTYLDV
jgi:hypothetical protein